MSKQDAGTMLLDRFAKREITRSMTMDEKALQLHVPSVDQHKLLSSIIIPTTYPMDMIQENETESY